MEGAAAEAVAVAGEAAEEVVGQLRAGQALEHTDGRSSLALKNTLKTQTCKHAVRSVQCNRQLHFSHLDPLSFLTLPRLY